MADLPESARRPTTHRMLIGASWVDPLDGASYEVRSPATGLSCAQLAAAGPADVDRAIVEARAAFLKYQDLPVFERAAWCLAVANTIEARAATIAEELTIEHGKPITDSLAEVASAANGFRLAAEEVKRLGGQTVPVADASKRVWTLRRPIGVIAVITPWNFPVNIPVEYLGPCLATGNAVVWKPAPSTSRIAVRLTECIAEAGVPAGLVNLLTGPSVAMAQRLVRHPDVVAVGFTGSSQVGRQIAHAVPEKRLLLELGGNGPVIVLGDAVLERAVPAIGHAAFWNAGQSCAAAERIIAEPAVYDDLVDGLTAHARNLRQAEPWLPESELGPVNNPEVAAKLHAHITDAVNKGATLTYGGWPIDGMPTELYLAPAVLRDVDSSAALHVEETFGPIAPVSRADGDGEIRRLVESSAHGLSMAIFTADLSRAIRLAERLPAGQVVINDSSNYWELHMPFGGWAGKESGRGRIGGRHALEAVTDLRTVSFDLR